MRTTRTMAATLLVLAAACGGAATTETVPSLEATPPAAPAGADVPGEDAAMTFAACMRENGVEDFADPVAGADGKITFPTKPSDDDAAEAYEACREVLEATTFGGEKATSDVEAIDALLELARCMREQGFDIPDPDPVTGGFGELDKDSPEFTEAFEQCGAALGGK